MEPLISKPVIWRRETLLNPEVRLALDEDKKLSILQ